MVEVWFPRSSVSTSSKMMEDKQNLSLGPRTNQSGVPPTRRGTDLTNLIGMSLTLAQTSRERATILR